MAYTDTDRRMIEELASKRTSARKTGDASLFTRADRAEWLRLNQKRRRASNTPTRLAMIRWRRSDAGRAARANYMRRKGHVTASARRTTPAYRETMRAVRLKTQRTAHQSRKPWTDDLDRALLRLTAEGRSASEIAVVMGRSALSIQHRRERLRELRGKTSLPLGCGDERP